MKKWETIKKKCAASAYQQIASHSGDVGALITLISARITTIQGCRESYQHYKISKELANQAYEIILKWDIRCFQQLRDLYPKEFPKGRLMPVQLDDETLSWALVNY